MVAEAAFGVISACYTNIAISVSFQRDQGILKRTRGTPLPGWAYMSARVVHAMVIAFVLVAITVAFGVIFYSASVPTGVPLLQFVLTLLVGGLSFAALALALTAAIPNADASPPIVNASILPLLFLSGIFIPIGDDAPAWITAVSNIFPVRHFFEAMVERVPRQPHGTDARRAGASVPVRLVGPRRGGGLGDRGTGVGGPLLQLGTAQVAALRRLLVARITLLGSGPERAFAVALTPEPSTQQQGVCTMRKLMIGLAAFAIIAAACAPEDDTPAASDTTGEAPATAEECAQGADIPLTTEGALTIGTGNPAYAPVVRRQERRRFRVGVELLHGRSAQR